MKVALVHELLTIRGGAERVLRILADMFPDAPIYTLLYNEQKLGDWFPRERIRTATLPTPYSLLPAHYKFNHHLYLRHFPRAVEAWDFFGYDLVISSSSAFAHGIITNGQPKHLCYVHSPARYLWDRTHDVLEQVGHGSLGWARRRYLERVFHTLRIWDTEAAARADKLLTVSREVQRRIELYWRRESEIVHPPIDDSWFESRFEIRDSNAEENYSSLESRVSSAANPPYYLIASTLARYKRIDLAIHACNKLKVPLKIAGDGMDRKRLESLAGPTIEFLGFTDETELKALYANANAVLFPGEEDFGLVPAEAMACGTPVIAYRAGGALESVVEGQTGAFFDQPTPESLARALVETGATSFDPERCKQQAAAFTREAFAAAINGAIATL